MKRIPHDAHGSERSGAPGGFGVQKSSRYDAQKSAQDSGANPLLRGEIVDFATDGRGVLKADGIVCFTEGGVIGDTVLVEATKRKKNFAEGKVREILAPSPDRVPSDCPHFGLCGGCDFREYAYEAQLDWKRSLVESVLRKIGGVSDVSVERIAGAERRVHYRNNVQFPVRVVDGRVRLCFFRKRSNRVVPVGACLLVPEAVNALIPDLEAAIEAAGIPVEEAEGERSAGGGVLRHIGVRISAAGALCLIAVVNAHVPERGERLVAEIARRGLLERFRIASVYENVHAGADQTFGREWNLLYGAREWEEELLGRRFLLSPASFFQVLRALAEKSPQRIVYVSCNPGTLARDVRFLLASGYGLKKVRVVDLFPYTTSVECIALIQRGKSTMPSAAPTKGVERK